MTPRTHSDESYLEYTRTTWNESAERYTKLLRNLEPYGFDLLARVDPKVRERCLDIATGPGEPALSIARMVGAEGRVTGIDLSEDMISLANRVAKERRISNVEFRVMDAENMDFPDGTFDLVTSRFGFQILTHCDRAALEAYRVLVPKGRIGVAVWSTADKASAIDAIMSPMLQFAGPDETGHLPSPYAFGGKGEMVKLLEGAGFSEAKEERKTHSMSFKDADEYIEVMSEGTPIGHSLREEDQPIQDKILARTRENLREWRSAKGIVIPCECVFVTAKK